jgi:hypothetical protein
MVVRGLPDSVRPEVEEGFFGGALQGSIAQDSTGWPGTPTAPVGDHPATLQLRQLENAVRAGW